MNVTINWLKEYIDFNLSPEELSDSLMMLGIETESIQSLGEGLDGVVIGKVKVVRAHPNAEKLVLCDVDAGTDADLTIVCGAPNAREGLIAPVALIGTQLPNGLRIKAAKIRGEASQGMLCSEQELGISDEAAGLMELPDDLPIGAPFTEALQLDDVMIELEVTPNRPDCLSIFGVAREIRAITGNPLKRPQVKVKEGNTDVQELTSVKIEAPELCPRYAARVIRGVKIEASPQWLQRRLESIGLVPINNIVDITNFVLMECGHPLHAFDYHKLAENRIVVRCAKAGETIKTLDEEERELTPDMLVIADAENPVAMAGIIGGFNSAITAETDDVLLESAYFHPPSIRKTSKTLGMHTDASHRFERGADRGGVIPAMNRAAQLIAEIAGGEVCAGVIDVYPGERDALRVKLRPARVNFVLGTDISEAEMKEILTRLEFTVSDDFEVTVPTFRPDVEREVDLIEEIARVHGYDNIPMTIPKGDIPIPPPDLKSELHNRVKAYLLGCGMMEAINYSFYHPNVFDRIRLEPDHPLRAALKLRNPLSEDMSIMRTTLIPSLLENAQRNRNHQLHDLQLFEMATVFMSPADGEVLQRRHRSDSPNQNTEFPDEPIQVTGIIAGNIGSGLYGDSQRPADFFDIKGVVEGVLNTCGITDFTLARTEHPTFHPGCNAEIRVNETSLCIFGEAHPEVLENYDLDNKAYLFELDFDKLVAVSTLTAQFELLPIYPSVNRDLAIILDTDIPANQPSEFIQATGGKLVKSVNLFDVYTGDQVPAGKKSLAYAIEYQSPTETLTDETVDRVHGKIVQRLERELGAKLRM
jgi:phenylalanyl-tRNA synthetase beta chain